MARRRRKSPVSFGEVAIWFLFFALLVPAGFVGWAISTATSGGTKTVTVTVAAAPATTQAATTTTAPAPATTTAAKPAPPKAAAGSGNAAAGKAVFLSSGCGACHTFKAAGTTGTVGPNLDTAPEADAKKTNTALLAFVRESIVSPDAYIAPGYSKGIMPTTFGSTLSKTKLDDLVAFVASAAK